MFGRSRVIEYLLDCSSRGRTKDERFDEGLNERSGEGQCGGQIIIYGSLFSQIICPTLRPILRPNLRLIFHPSSSKVLPAPHRAEFPSARGGLLYNPGQISPTTNYNKTETV